MTRAWTAAVAVSLLLGTPLLATVSLGPAAAADGPTATLNYTIDPASYNNTVRVAPYGTMEYPRVVVDRHTTSPRHGTLYVVGVTGSLPPDWHEDLVTSTSEDGGRTFAAPIQADVNLSYEYPNLNPFPTLRDLVISSNGTLFADLGSQGIVASWDGGQSWNYRPVWNSTLFVAALAWDETSERLYAVVGEWASETPLLLTSSLDGSTWAEPHAVPSVNATTTAVQLAVRAGVVLLSYVSYRPNLTGMDVPQFFLEAESSPDGGASWNENVTLDAQPSVIVRPQVTVSRQGVFGVAWETLRRTVSQYSLVDVPVINLAYSGDGGRTFAKHLHLAEGANADYSHHGVPMVLDDASRMYVAWSAYADYLNTTGSRLFTAVNGTASGDFQNASFVTTTQDEGSSWTNEEDLGLGTNGTVYLVWFAYHYAANFTLIPETSGIFLRAVTGAAGGAVDDPDGVFGNRTPWIELRDEDGRVQAQVAWNGTPVEITNLTPQDYSVRIVNGSLSLEAGGLSVRIWGLTSFTLALASGSSGGPTGPPNPTESWIPPVIVAAAVVALGTSLALLHYTRLTRENVFQQKQRLLLYEYVRDHPGTTQAEVRRVFGLQNGVAAYHLDVLERQGFLHTEARRGHRWYYPSGDASLWRDVPLSPLQAAIVHEIERRPGIGVRELSRNVDRKPSSVAENVKSLECQGVLRTQRSGARLHCYPAQVPKTG